MKIQTNVKLDTATRNMMKFLAFKTKRSEGQVIAIAIEEMWTKEYKKYEKISNYEKDFKLWLTHIQNEKDGQQSLL